MEAILACRSKSPRGGVQTISGTLFLQSDPFRPLCHCLPSSSLLRVVLPSCSPLTPLRAEGRPARAIDVNLVFSFSLP